MVVQSLAGYDDHLEKSSVSRIFTDVFLTGNLLITKDDAVRYVKRDFL